MKQAITLEILKMKQLLMPFFNVGLKLKCRIKNEEQRFCAAFLKPILTVIFCLNNGYLFAQPYTPLSLNEVILERTYPIFSSGYESTGDRVKSNAEVILQANKFVEYGLAKNDPRYLAYAQGLLTPWWQQKEAPLEIRFLRARIHQQSHKFDLAIEDLEGILAMNPRNVQALLLRANAYRVTGKLQASLNDCKNLLWLADALVTFNCIAQVKALTDDPVQVAHQLEQLYSSAINVPENLQQEVYTTLAELYLQADQLTEAEVHYRQALNYQPDSPFLINRYAQLLIQAQRWKAVLNLLPNSMNGNSALIQRAIASKALELPETNNLIQTLKARFSLNEQRGDIDISKDLAQFYLKLLSDPQKAVQYAYRNWQYQKEMSDTKLLIEAAQLANNKAVLNEVNEWLTLIRNKSTFITSTMKTGLSL